MSIYPAAICWLTSCSWTWQMAKGQNYAPMGADVATQALHVWQEVQVVNGQALILQEHHRADVHGVRQEGRRGHDAVRVLHRRQRLRASHSRGSAKQVVTAEYGYKINLWIAVDLALQALGPQCTAYALHA